MTDKRFKGCTIELRYRGELIDVDRWSAEHNEPVLNVEMWRDVPDIRGGVMREHMRGRIPKSFVDSYSTMSGWNITVLKAEAPETPTNLEHL